jgi:hypothetical protein
MNTRDLGTRPPGYIGIHPAREAALSHPASLNHERVAITPDYGDGRISIERSFTEDIQSRVEALRSRFTVRPLGSIEYGPHIYPLYEISAIQNPENPFVRLSGIVHGDEPAGGKAILTFFERDIERYLQHFNFIANPCVNPSGFEACSLQAMNGYHPECRSNKNTGNINRSFGFASDQQEARLIEASLKEGPSRYLFSMDMHECVPYYTDEVYTPEDAPKAAWVYESCGTEARRIGRALVESLPHDIEVCTWEKIYSDRNDGGVIPFHPTTTGHAEYHEPTSLDGHIFAHYTGHSFTTETATGWKLEKRIRAQLHFLTHVLDTYIKRLEDVTPGARFRDGAV